MDFNQIINQSEIETDGIWEWDKDFVCDLCRGCRNLEIEKNGNNSTRGMYTEYIPVCKKTHDSLHTREILSCSDYVKK